MYQKTLLVCLVDHSEQKRSYRILIRLFSIYSRKLYIYIIGDRKIIFIFIL